MTRIWNKHKLNTPLKRKVFVAMSGGVDSSVAAYLLCLQGYEVTGVYMKNWSEESFGSRVPKLHCPWRDDVKQVKAVCKILLIPMKVYNFEREYSSKVIEPFFTGQTRGLTPNPDIVCNRVIKFGLFAKRAFEQGADYIATGHYISKRVVKAPNSASEVHQLYAAKDKDKDQSYFLCTVTQAQLRKSIFPLGKHTKREVRVIAKKIGLPNAERAESMGICFVGEVKMRDFLKTRISENPGDIVDTEGKAVGRHSGLAFYTIGQRQGVGVSGGPVPYYVCSKKVKANQLVIAKGSRNKALFSKEVYLKRINWLSGDAPQLPIKCHSRIRYRQPLQACVLKKRARSYVVAFHRRQRAVTAGQYCALYFNKVLLAGGEIVGTGC